MSVGKLFRKYVSQNILGMLGISLYILADTFFISRAEGANGITALNLVLPIYSLIFAIGQMIGVGSATRFKIASARKDENAGDYFSNAVFFALLFGAVFMLLGALVPDKLVALLGGDAEIVAVGTSYTRIFMLFSPFFMWNHICNAFVRNDGAPSLAMAAVLSSSLFNIVMDYILMFPLKLGMSGAALATAVSPILGIAICSIHFFSRENTIKIKRIHPSVKRLIQSMELGVAAFVGELSSGVTTVVFNTLILGLAGNVGVAAYGVVANMALVATSVFNGISQGSQPLFSEFYGKGEKEAVKKTRRLSIATALLVAAVMFVLVFFFAETITAVFNSEHSVEMRDYAVSGIRLYFIGFLFAGFNIAGTGYLSAVEAAGWASFLSILRGFVAIILCAVVLAAICGMTGVWLAFPAAELITAIFTMTALWKYRNK